MADTPDILQSLDNQMSGKNNRSPAPKHSNRNQRTPQRGGDRAQGHGAQMHKDRKDQKRGGNRQDNRRDRQPFDAHLPRDELVSGLEQGIFVKGPIRINPRNPDLSYLTVPGYELDVAIEGRRNRNRAFEGDEVVVQLFPQKLWAKVKKHSYEAFSLDDEEDEQPRRSKKHTDGDDTDTATDTETEGEDEQVDAGGSPMLQPAAGEPLDPKTPTPNPVQTISAPVSEGPSHVDAPDFSLDVKSSEFQLQPTGKVVGILKENRIPVVSGILTPCRGRDTVVQPTDAFIQFLPVDKRLPKGMLDKRSWPENFAADPKKWQDTLIGVSYGPWSHVHHWPSIKIVRVIGTAGYIPTEVESILSSHGVEYDHEGKFDPEIERELVDMHLRSQIPIQMPNIPVPPPNQPLSPDMVTALIAGWQVTPEDLSKRLDLRASQRIFSIDPLTTRDIDDALSVEPLDDGTFRCGVHIADVSYFVRSGMLTDLEAQKRCTTIYLPHKALTMLPHMLSSTLCSLERGKDRFAFSVFFRLHADGSRVLTERPWFGKTIIRSCSKLDYGSAQMMIEAKIAAGAVADVPVHPKTSHNDTVNNPLYNEADSDDEAKGKDGKDSKDEQKQAKKGVLTMEQLKQIDEHLMRVIPLARPTDEFAHSIRQQHTYTHHHHQQPQQQQGDNKEAEQARYYDRLRLLIDDVWALHVLAKGRRRTRFATGSLALNSSRMNFQLERKVADDPNSIKPVDVVTYINQDANKLVEEFMLYGNQFVAEQLSLFCGEIALLRCHPPPKPNSLAKFLVQAQSLGIPIDARNAGSLHKSLERICPNNSNISLAALSVPSAGLSVVASASSSSSSSSSSSASSAATPAPASAAAPSSSAKGPTVVSSSNAISASLTSNEGGVAVISDPAYLRKVLESLATRPMQQAKYFCAGGLADPAQWLHYALNFELYTHYTSPIRRYPDILVHRLLSYSLELEQYRHALTPASPLFLSAAIPAHSNNTASALPAHVALVKSQALPEKAVPFPSLTTPLNQPDSSIAPPLPPFTREWSKSIVERCNVRKIEAKRASEDCAKVFLVVLLDDWLKGEQKCPPSRTLVFPSGRPAPAPVLAEGAVTPVVNPPPILQTGALLEQAVIVDIGDKSFDVLFMSFGFEKRVQLDQLLDLEEEEDKEGKDTKDAKDTKDKDGKAGASAKKPQRSFEERRAASRAASLAPFTGCSLKGRDDGQAPAVAIRVYEEPAPASAISLMLATPAKNRSPPRSPPRSPVLNAVSPTMSPAPATSAPLLSLGSPAIKSPAVKKDRKRKVVEITWKASALEGTGLNPASWKQRLTILSPVWIELRPVRRLPLDLHASAAQPRFWANAATESHSSGPSQ